MKVPEYMKEFAEQLTFDTFDERFSDVSEGRKEAEVLRIEAETLCIVASRKKEEASRKDAEIGSKEIETHLLLSSQKMYERGDSIEEIMDVLPFFSREKIMAAINTK